MIDAKGTNVKAVGFDAGVRGKALPRILVQFQNGLYECLRRDGRVDIATATFDGLLASDHKTAFYNMEIRRKTECWLVRKVEAESEESRKSNIEDVSDQMVDRPSLSRIADGRERPALILTMGLPYSGKSTWARSTGFPIVSADAIRLGLHGRAYEQLAEPFVWAHARLMVRALFGAGHRVVVLDSCAVTRARRDEWRGETWDVYVRPFSATPDECRGRLMERFRDYALPFEEDVHMLEVIERMSKKYESAAADEGLWEEPIDTGGA